VEEIAMAKVNISKMDVQSLMDLRKRVDERLLEHRAEIQKQLNDMNRAIGGYRYLGLKFVSRSWFNLDTTWAFSLVLVGALSLVISLASRQ